MIFATFKNYNGNGTCYNIIHVKSKSEEILKSLHVKEHAYHEHMPGSGYCSIDFETVEYNQLLLMRNLVAEQIINFYVIRIIIICIFGL